MSTPRYALISVSDKTGIVDFARRLAACGFTLISTGGTFSALAAAGLTPTRIDDITGFPEMLDGRVKTLHPRIHGGLLARRDIPDHLNQLAAHGIHPIDLVVVNLYPFESTVASGADRETCIENIDIGGPSMLRSAAKNAASVTVICDPCDYDPVATEIETLGDTAPETRARLAATVFVRTSQYDQAIARYLTQDPKADVPTLLGVTALQEQSLRYGENPHQAAALYGHFLSHFTQLHGKELSFNNIVDVQAAVLLVEEFDDPAVAIIKHTNPCGCAKGASIAEAYEQALATDPASAFGGIISCNRTVDATFATRLNEMFSEVLIAPAFSEDAIEILRKKKDRRLLVHVTPLRSSMSTDIKAVAGGYLCQTADTSVEDPATWKVVTHRAPSAQEMEALTFAWRVCKHVKSNAIVYTDATRTLGVGAGQMSRVDSSVIAVLKARNAGLSLTNSVMASDAFFPFADGLLAAVEAGATAVIQPGGSVRDAEVIAAANAHDIAMVFTGIRHFKH